MSNKNKIQTTSIIDLSTGEQKERVWVVEPEPGDMISVSTEESRKEQKAEKERQKKQRYAERELRRQETGIFESSYTRVIHHKKDPISLISNNDAFYLLVMSTFTTRQSDNYLVIQSGNRRGKKANEKEIAEMLGMSLKNYRRIVERLSESKVNLVAKDGEGYLQINKQFVSTTSRGKGRKNAFTKVLAEKILKDYEEKLTKAEIGALLKICKNVHYTTFFFTLNPDHNIITEPKKLLAQNITMNSDQLEYLNQTEIIELMGVENRVGKRYFKKYLENGIIFNNLDSRDFDDPDFDGRESIYLMNPAVMYRMDLEDAVYGYFEHVMSMEALISASKNKAKAKSKRLSKKAKTTAKKRVNPESKNKE